MYLNTFGDFKVASLTRDINSVYDRLDSRNLKKSIEKKIRRFGLILIISKFK